MSKQNFISQYIDFLSGRRNRPSIPKGMHVSAAREYQRIMNAMQPKKPRSQFAKKLEKQLAAEVKGVKEFSITSLIPAASIAVLAVGVGIGVFSFLPQGRDGSQFAALPTTQNTSVQSRVLGTAGMLADSDLAEEAILEPGDEMRYAAAESFAAHDTSSGAGEVVRTSTSDTLALAVEIEKILEGVELLESINDDEIFADLERDFVDYSNGVVGSVYITQYGVEAGEATSTDPEVIPHRPVEIRALPSSQYQLNVARDALTSVKASGDGVAIRAARIEVLRESGAVIVSLLNERLAGMDTDQILDTGTKLEFSSDLARMRARIAEAIPLLDGAETDRQLQFKALLLRNSWRAVQDTIDMINDRRVSVAISQTVDHAEQGLNRLTSDIPDELRARLQNLIEQLRSSIDATEQKSLLRQFIQALK